MYLQPSVSGILLLNKIWLCITNICSALMKLHKNYSCTSLSVRLERTSDPALSIRLRDCSKQSYNTMVDISLKVIDFAQSLEHKIVGITTNKLSPFVLQCIYRAAIWLSDLAASTGEEKFAAGRSICDRVLKISRQRWIVAGNDCILS